jgi:hypothetical protein
VDRVLPIGFANLALIEFIRHIAASHKSLSPALGISSEDSAPGLGPRHALRMQDQPTQEYFGRNQSLLLVADQ